MATTTSRKESAAKTAVQLLSSCVEGGRVFVFFAQDDKGFASVSAPATAGQIPSLQLPENWNWLFGPDVTASQQKSLTSHAQPLLTQALPSLTSRLAKRLEAGSFVVPPQADPLPNRFLFNASEKTSWTLKLPATGRELLIDLAAVGELDFSYMDWSVKFDVEGDPLIPAESAQAAQFFFVSVARFLLGVGPERKADDPAPNSPAGPDQQADPNFSLSLNLADELTEETLTQLASLTAKQALIHLALPSQCANRCLFCQKAHEPAATSEVPTDTVLKRVQAVVDSLNMATGLQRVDLSLGGDDCLESSALYQSLLLVHSITKLDQINLVTPGTRLGEEGMVDALVKAGVHRVSLSLLGPDEARHDALAGRPGAFQQLKAAVESLDREGLAFDLATVVVVDSLPHLVETVELAYAWAGPVSLYFYLADPTVPQARTTLLMPRLDQFKELLATHQTQLEGKLRGVEHVPLCALPEWARPLAGSSNRTHPDPVAPTLPTCSQCAAYGSLCQSVTKVYHALHGEAGLVALNQDAVDSFRKAR